MATVKLNELLKIDPKKQISLTLEELGLACTAALALPEMEKPENAAVKTALTILSIALNASGIVIQVYQAIQTLLPIVHAASQAGASVMNPAEIPHFASDQAKNVAGPLVDTALNQVKTQAANQIFNLEVHV